MCLLCLLCVDLILFMYDGCFVSSLMVILGIAFCYVLICPKLVMNKDTLNHNFHFISIYHCIPHTSVHMPTLSLSYTIHQYTPKCKTYNTGNEHIHLPNRDSIFCFISFPFLSTFGLSTEASSCSIINSAQFEGRTTIMPVSFSC